MAKIVEMRAEIPKRRPLARHELALYPSWQVDKKNPQNVTTARWSIEQMLSSGLVERHVFFPGFLDDGGSVPDAVPDAIADDHGWLGQQLAYENHDGEYGCHYSDRLTADQRLYDTLRLVGVGWLKSQLVYHSVRLAGGSPWEKTDEQIKKYRELVKFEILPRWSLNTNNPEVITWRKNAA